MHINSVEGHDRYPSGTGNEKKLSCPVLKYYGGVSLKTVRLTADKYGGRTSTC
jgi:hypothetical protein